MLTPVLRTTSPTVPIQNQSPTDAAPCFRMIASPVMLTPAPIQYLHGTGVFGALEYVILFARVTVKVVQLVISPAGENHGDANRFLEHVQRSRVASQSSVGVRISRFP